MGGKNEHKNDSNEVNVWRGAGKSTVEVEDDEVNRRKSEPKRKKNLLNQVTIFGFCGTPREGTEILGCINRDLENGFPDFGVIFF